MPPQWETGRQERRGREVGKEGWGWVGAKWWEGMEVHGRAGRRRRVVVD